MSKLDTIEVTAPSAWASYLINDDASGLDDHDVAECDAWVASLAPHSCAIDCEDAGFRHHHDAHEFTPYSGDCQTYTFMDCASVEA